MPSYFSSHHLLGIYYAPGRHYAKWFSSHKFSHVLFIRDYFNTQKQLWSTLGYSHLRDTQTAAQKNQAIGSGLPSQAAVESADIGLSIFESPPLGLQPGLLTVTVLLQGLNERTQVECNTQNLAPSTELLYLMFFPFSMTPTTPRYQ